MKKRVLTAAVALAVSIFTAGVSFAHPRAQVADIPFDFEAGNKTLHAGKYRIESVPTGDGTLQWIRRMGGDAQILIVASIALTPGKGNNLPRLVFHKYGTTYFLAQIWNGDGRGRQLFESKQEIEAARGEARTEVALSVE